ncbi:MAG TPA: rhodanese-like domain-containing protein [Bacteroidia bacterium]|jgi:phage shock protein E|nr:rhodanese-like domain-containing protein [Bacteroidia bacterium]
MLNTLKKFFGIGPGVDLGALIAQGAVIVDVRSRGEYAGGHVKGSLNIPLDQLENNLKKFKSKEQVIITCCASGMRSASAKGILQRKGFLHVHNGGSWHNVQKHC